MPRFQLALVSDAPERTKTALERAGIDTLTPFSFIPGSPDDRIHIEPRMTAIVEAASEEAAIALVRDAIGEDCDIQPNSR
jgi:hypothetical protein